jgi:DNA-binding NarL/FixJ family response regulator
MELSLGRKILIDFSPGNFLGEEETMTSKEQKKGKHLTLDERIEIQECLNRGVNFKAIAKRIEKDQTTVSKEIKLHRKSVCAIIPVVLINKL